MCRSLEKCAKEDGVFTLCMVDSDIKYGPSKRFPNAPEKGGTAKSVIKTYEQLQDIPIVFLFCIPAHEIENLIPISVLEYLGTKQKKDWSKLISVLKKLLNSELQSSILLYDIKKGETIDKVCPQSEYWREIGERIGETLFPGVGKRSESKVLKDSFDVMSGETETELHFFRIGLDYYLKEKWDEIGEVVFSWGCANDPMRA